MRLTPVLETELKALDYESMFPSNYIDFFKKDAHSFME